MLIESLWSETERQDTITFLSIEELWYELGVNAWRWRIWRVLPFAPFFFEPSDYNPGTLAIDTSSYSRSFITEEVSDISSVYILPNTRSLSGVWPSESFIRRCSDKLPKWSFSLDDEKSGSVAIGRLLILGTRRKCGISFVYFLLQSSSQLVLLSLSICSKHISYRRGFFLLSFFFAYFGCSNMYGRYFSSVEKILLRWHLLSWTCSVSSYLATGSSLSYLVVKNSEYCLNSSSSSSLKDGFHIFFLS